MKTSTSQRSRRRFAVLTLLTLLAAIALAPLGGVVSAEPSEIALFFDSAYVDTTDSSSGEARNVKLALEELGHSVTTFEGIAASDFSAAVSGRDTLLIPEQEVSNLAPDVDEAARAAISNFVSSGGKLVIHGDHSFAGSDTGAADLLNDIFGFSLSEVLVDGTGPFPITGAAGGTEFEGGPGVLEANDGSNGLELSSLPSGAKSIYDDGTNSIVALMFWGSGSIIFLGWDWFNSEPPNEGGQNGDWLEVLDRAVTVFLASGPDPSSQASNRLEVFVRGTDDQLYQKTWNGSTWSDFIPLGGVLTSDPTAVSWADGRIDVFVRGADNGLWHKWFANGVWSGWEPLGGVLTSAPDVSSWAPNRLDVFVRGTDNQLWHKWWNGSTWSGYEPLGGALTGGPGAVSWDTNRIDVFVRGTDNQLWHKWWNGSAWSGYEPLGGVLTSDPDPSSWAPNRLDVFVRGTDNQLYHRWWDGSSWRGYEPLGGVLTSSPGAVSWGFNRIDVFVRGTDGALLHRWWDGTSWQGYESLGGQLQ